MPFHQGEDVARQLACMDWGDRIPAEEGVGLNHRAKRQVWNLSRVRDIDIADKLVQPQQRLDAVSYTHLDVYKRQVMNWIKRTDRSCV